MPTSLQKTNELMGQLMEHLQRQKRSVLVNLFDSVVALEEHLSCHVSLKNNVTVTHENGAQYEFFIGIKRVEEDEDEGDLDDFES